MRTLSLLRHAKSRWDEPGLADFDRPLAPRGFAAASAMGAHLWREDLVPDLVLCSKARRARDTHALIAAEWQVEVPVGFDDRLYGATTATLLALLAEAPTQSSHLMIVGHNPALHRLALVLSGGGDDRALRRLHRKFPTAAIAVIALDAGTWRTVAPGGGRLAHFVRPKDLQR